MEPARLHLARLRGGVSLHLRHEATLGAPRVRFAIVDSATAFTALLGDAEAAVALALRDAGGVSVALVDSYVAPTYGLDVAVDAATIDAVLGGLRRHQLLATDTPFDADAQLTERGLDERDAAIGALRDVLGWMATEVPLYRERLASVDPCSVRDPADLARLPRLSKGDLRERLEDLQPRDLTGQPIARTVQATSGTTAERTQVLQGGFRADNGVVHQITGIPEGARVAVLVSPICSGTACHMEEDRPLAQRRSPGALLLNSFASPCTVGSSRLDAAVDELRAFAPQVLAVQAPYAAALARHVRDRGLDLPRIQRIVTINEVCSSLHRHLLERVFRCPVTDVFCGTEVHNVACECELGNYHVAASTHLELLTDDGPARPGEVGVMVWTTLSRRFTPLLRFESGDLATAVASCRCRNAHTQVFARPEGRVVDCVADRSGRRVTPRQVDDAVWRAAGPDTIAYYSLVQRDAHRHHLSLAPDRHFVGPTVEEVRRSLLELLGADVEITVGVEREILPAGSGKFRLCRREA